MTTRKSGAVVEMWVNQTRELAPAWRFTAHTRDLADAKLGLAGSVRAVDGDAAALAGQRRARDLTAGLADSDPGPQHTRDLAAGLADFHPTANSHSPPP